MTEYDVVIETTAVFDMRGVFDYITDVLKQPEAARRIFFSIEEKAMSLNRMPKRYNLVRDEHYAGIGVRSMPVENYTAFYVVDETEHVVHILRVLYNRREWRDLL